MSITLVGTIDDIDVAANTPASTALGIPDYLAYLPHIAGPSLSFSVSIPNAIDIDLVQEYTWRNSPVPMWSSVLKRLKYYESQYNLASDKMYADYKTSYVQNQIPSNDLRDWVNSYVMYAH